MTIRTRATVAPRTMFNSGMGLSMMLRGPSIPFDGDDEAGGELDQDPALEEQDTPGEGEGDGDGDGDGAGDPPGDKKPTDAEAKLLREQMKTKKALKAAKDAEKAAKDALAAYKGADPSKVAELLAKEADAERASLEAKGEYDRILAQVNEQHAAAIGEANTQLQSTKDQLAAAQAQIEELTIGADFANSTFLRDKTILTPKKARQLYGSHVDQVDGVSVVYDKPRGAANRTPLVDASGGYLSFEAGIEKLISGDEDFERFAKSNLKPGSGSLGNQHKIDENKPAEVAPGVGRLAANLGKLKEKANK